MAITFSCTCGKGYTVDDALAGKRTRCPACRAALVVPTPAPVEEVSAADIEVVEDDPAAGYGFAADEARPAAEEEPERVAEVVSDAPAKAKDERPPYFMVAFDGSSSLLHKPKFFRVYPDEDALLFINAGPFIWSAVDALQGQEGVRALATRTGAAHGAEVGLGMGLLASVAMAIFNAVDAKELAKRAAVLDAMTMEQLRAEATSEKSSFRVTPANTTEPRIEPPATGIFANQNIEPKIVGRVRFRHDPTGKWGLLLLTKPDARAAIRGFRLVFGRDNVDVALRLKKERG